MSWLEGRTFDASSVDNFFCKVSGSAPIRVSTPTRSVVSGRSAFTFNGASAQELAYTRLVKHFDLPITATCLFNQTAAGGNNQTLVAFGGSYSDKGWRFGTRSYGQLLVTMSGATDLYTLSFSSGWNVASVTMDNTTSISYLNGRYVSSSAHTGYATTNGCIRLGGFGGGDNFTGSISRAIIHRKCLSRGEIEEMHNNLLYNRYPEYERLSIKNVYFPDEPIERPITPTFVMRFG